MSQIKNEDCNNRKSLKVQNFQATAAGAELPSHSESVGT
jgi:hypothetical protein